MKRSVCLLLALVAAVVLAGCGKGDPTVAKIRRGTKVIEACAYKDNKDIKTVVIPDSVTTIGAEAFRDCDSLESVVIPDSVTVIEPEAFYSCDSLKSIELPDSLVTIGNTAFAYCEALTEVTIPGSVVVKSEDEREWHKDYGTEDYGVFEGCHSLTKVTFKDGLQRIGPAWFDFCDALTAVEMPDSVISIEKEAFSLCRALTSVRFSHSLVAIERHAFQKCTALTSVDLPDSVKELDDAFEDCTSLAEVRMSGGIERLSGAFKGCKALAAIELPESLVSMSDVDFRGTALMEGAETLIGGDWDAFRAALDAAEDLTGEDSPLEALAGKRVMPVADHGDVCVNGALFCALPTDVRTIDWREADYVLYVACTSEARDDYIGFAYNRTTWCWLRSKDGGAKLLFKDTDTPPISGYGTLSGDEATPEEIWEGIRRFFGK